MSYYDYLRKGTLRDRSIHKVHKELMESTGAYWRPYSFYTGMNTYSVTPTGRAVSVHIKRSGNLRTQDKALCGLIICEEVKDFDYNSPRLCKSCRKFDLAVEQNMLNRLKVMASSETKRHRDYVRDRRGRFARGMRVKIVRR